MTLECEVGPAHAGDSVYSGAELIGSVTSGGYGHRVQKNIAYAFVAPELAAVGTELEIGILGERYPAVVCEECLYDAEYALVRS